MIFGIRDPVEPVLSRNPRDLGSQTEKKFLYLGDPGSYLSHSEWDLVDLGLCTIIMSLYSYDEDLYISYHYVFGSKSICFVLCFASAIVYLFLSTCMEFQLHVDCFPDLSS